MISHITDLHQRCLFNCAHPVLEDTAIAGGGAFARDVARGVDASWVRNLYRFAVRPTIGFYFRISVEEALRRVVGGRDAISYYERPQRRCLLTVSPGRWRWRHAAYMPEMEERSRVRGDTASGGVSKVATLETGSDRKRFLMIELAVETKRIVVVQNWFQELKRLVPAD